MTNHFRGGRRTLTLAALALACAAGLTACNKGSNKTQTTSTGNGGTETTTTSTITVHKAADPAAIKLAFISNNPSEYWKICEGGTKKFTKETGIPVDFRTPSSGKVEDQNGIIENCVSNGYDGIAVSVIAPDDQVSEINSAAAKINVICCDSDSPKSNRIEYVGTENYTAGQELGKDIVALLPKGGKIAVFVGTFSADNAAARLKGIEDEIKGHDIDIVEKKEDNKDNAKARSNVEDVMNAHPDLAMVVGLWSYNGPAIAAAIEGSGKKGKVLAAVFDQEAGTLAGVTNGTITCTVVQDPFAFGYAACKQLQEMSTQGPAFKIPADHKVLFPVETVNAQNIDAYEKKLAAEKAS